MPSVADLLDVVERLAPARLAEPWDNIGLLVGRRTGDIDSVLVALDLRHGVLDRAIDAGIGAILVHHPPIFPALTSLTDVAGPEGVVLRAAEAGIAVVAAHTNLDSVVGGLNDLMAARLGIVDGAPLEPVATAVPGAGLGRVGSVPPILAMELAERVRAAFPGSLVRLAGSHDAPVRRVACCTGSGASLIQAARSAGADAYVTSDLKYHDADRAGGMILVDLPHAQSEAPLLAEWAESRLQPALFAVGIAVDQMDGTDPWHALP